MDFYHRHSQQCGGGGLIIFQSPGPVVNCLNFDLPQYKHLWHKPASLPDAPRGQAVIRVPYGTVVVAGAPIRLQCDPPEDSGHPAATWYEWSVRGGQTDRLNRSSNKWLQRTHSVTQSANYSCRVGNRVGASKFSRWLEVTVQGRWSLGLFTGVNIYLLGGLLRAGTQLGNLPGYCKAKPKTAFYLHPLLAKHLCRISSLNILSTSNQPAIELNIL